MTPEALESRTLEIGREVFARANSAGASIFSANWWDQRAMALSMRDPAVKVQLFRLVDTLPALKSNREVTRHLKADFEAVRGRVPAVVARATGWIPERGWLGDVVAKAARFNATRMARRFI